MEQDLQSNLLSDKVSLYKGDITVLEVDAIVNAGKSHSRKKGKKLFMYGFSLQNFLKETWGTISGIICSLGDDGR